MSNVRIELEATRMDQRSAYRGCVKSKWTPPGTVAFDIWTVHSKVFVAYSKINSQKDLKAMHRQDFYAQSCLVHMLCRKAQPWLLNFLLQNFVSFGKKLRKVKGYMPVWVTPFIWPPSAPLGQCHKNTFHDCEPPLHLPPRLYLAHIILAQHSAQQNPLITNS